MGGRYGLEIRAATATDAPGLAELLAAAGRPSDPAALARRLERMRGEAGLVLVAADWGPPAGLVALHWRHGLEADAPLAVADVLVVAPEDRRRGVGRLLLKAAAQAARQAGCDRLHLPAAAEAEDLAAFALATGFARAGVRFERPLRKKG